MPKFNARDVPDIYHRTSQINNAWLDSGATLSTAWHNHMDYTNLRCVPLDVAEWLQSRARRNEHGPALNCDTYATSCFVEIYDWYRRKKLGRPACGKTVWHDFEPDEDDYLPAPVRHSMAWCVNEDGEVWILDTSFDVIYPPNSIGGVYEYIWA